MNNKKEEKGFEAEVLLCDCSSGEHQILLFADEEDKVVYCHTFLAQRGFWGRVKYGIKYIFGYKCKYGHFDEFMLTKKHLPKFKEIIKVLEN